MAYFKCFLNMDVIFSKVTRNNMYILFYNYGDIPGFECFFVFIPFLPVDLSNLIWMNAFLVMKAKPAKTKV